MFAVGVVVYKILTGKFPYHCKIFNDPPGQNFVGSPSMINICQSLRTYPINWNHSVLKRCPDARDLLQRMLQYEYTERITVDEALEHFWMLRAKKQEDILSPKHKTPRRS